MAYFIANRSSRAPSEYTWYYVTVYVSGLSVTSVTLSSAISELSASTHIHPLPMSFFQHSQNTDAHGGTFNNVDGNQINGGQVNNIGQIIYHRPNNFGTMKWHFTLSSNTRLVPDPLAQLSPVLDAVHNSIRSVSGCMEGTRQEVIEKIVQWIDGDGNQSICWLQGAAGAGKSAISRTIAEMCATSNRLAASFFFLRGAGRRSSITHLISTLAYNIAFSVPATRAYIENVVRRDPNILHRSLDHQFRALVAEPMQSVQGLSQPMVIVIDALDECNDKSMIAEFIEIVARDCPLLRFFFTSRVEEHIRERFSASPALPATHRLALQDFYADDDLELYFRSRFSTIFEQKRRLMGNISLPWPSESDIAQLVERSAGSFIFAFTLVNFVNDGRDLPHRKLRACLQSHAGLDPLYIQILQTAPRPPHFLQIFETIMTISEQLSIMHLACIFQVETGDIVHALLGVQSILIVPEDDNQPVRPFHTSLRDFLTTKVRSEDFFINPPTRHLSIASDCLTAMTSCNGDEIFESRALRFTARSWIKHFLCAIQEDGADNILCSQDGAVMINKLIDFLSLSFDSWLNSIIYQIKLEETTENLDKVISLLNASSRHLVHLVEIIGWSFLCGRFTNPHQVCYQWWRKSQSSRKYVMLLPGPKSIRGSLLHRFQSVRNQDILMEMNINYSVGRKPLHCTISVWHL